MSQVEAWVRWRLKHRPYCVAKCRVCQRDFNPRGRQKVCAKCRFLKCVHCGKRFGVRDGRYRQRFCSSRCRALAHPEVTLNLIAHRGPGRPRTKFSRRTRNTFDKEWRDLIFKRDNWTCQKCGARGVYIEAHHIKAVSEYPRLRYLLSNGITLCLDCHKRTASFGWRGYWRQQRKKQTAQIGLFGGNFNGQKEEV